MVREPTCKARLVRPRVKLLERFLAGTVDLQGQWKREAEAECGLDYRYELLPTPPENFSRRIVNCLEEGFVGWNVTVPHKERILPYLHQRSDAVEATGACNTVRVEGRTLVGFNTDPTGFTAGLARDGLTLGSTR